MILLVAVIVGVIAGIARVQFINHLQRLQENSGDSERSVTSRHFSIPPLRQSWLVLVAFIPQLLAFYLSSTSRLFSDNLAAVALTISQLLLLFFGWQNRHYPAFFLLIVGLAANFLVIVSNGGLMPMSPTTLGRLVSAERAATWQIGERIAQTKDRLLREEETYFAFLSDRLIAPSWIGKRLAYSIGDVLIALGAFWFFWSASIKGDIAGQR